MNGGIKFSRMDSLWWYRCFSRRGDGRWPRCDHNSPSHPFNVRTRLCCFSAHNPPETSHHEVLCDGASADRSKPTSTIVPLPALLHLHCTFYLSSKKLGVSGSWHMFFLLPEHCPTPPTIFIDYSFTSVSFLLKNYLLGEASPNPLSEIAPSHPSVLQSSILLCYYS